MEYNVLDFGAVGDGISIDTAAIQAAIDACRTAGGGKVLLPGGRVYRAGVLVLCSDLEFHLEPGSVLKGSDDLSDYQPLGHSSLAPQKLPVPSYENCEYTGAPSHYFLYAKDCENLSITGFGRIDGNEELFYGEVTPWHIEGSFYPRVPMMFLENVSHLTITQVTLARSAFWTVHMVGCRDVLIDGIRILNNLRMANCDGIDPDHCQNVRIANCHIECADDCIVFKNTAAAMQYGPCENITVTNCTLSTSSAAIKFGSESEALFCNILVENCAVNRSSRGISLQLRDKGSIENVFFHNLTIRSQLFKRPMFWGASEPIAITVLKRKEDTQVGTVRNVHFSNIFCDCENGILIYGGDKGLVSGISFRDLTISLRKITEYETGYHDLRPTVAPPYTETELCYVYAHNAADLLFRDCSFRAEADMAAKMASPHHFSACDSIQI